jgi:hypothetical protein
MHPNENTEGENHLITGLHEKKERAEQHGKDDIVVHIDNNLFCELFGSPVAVEFAYLSRQKPKR